MKTVNPMEDLQNLFLSDQGIPGVLSMGQTLDVPFPSERTWWPTLQTMQVAQPDDQILNQCNLCLLVAKFAINTRSSKIVTNRC